MSKRSSDGNVIGFLAFVAIICWALVQILGAFHIGNQIFSMISTLATLIILFWSAWLFVAPKKKSWRTIYFVVLIFAVLGFVWGQGWFIFWE